MSETISLEWIGQTLRAIQAEQRALHTENRLIRDELAHKLTREEAERMVRAFLGHVSAFEARTETRFDRLETRFDGLETRFDGLETRFGGLETRFGGLETRFDRLETRFDQLAAEIAALRPRE